MANPIANQPFKVQWTYDPNMLQYVKEFIVSWGSQTNSNLSGSMPPVMAPALSCQMVAFSADTYRISVNAIPVDPRGQAVMSSSTVEFDSANPDPVPIPVVVIPAPGAPQVVQV